MGKKLIFCDWSAVPHLTEEMRAAQLQDMDPHLRDARTRGIPFLGSGAVYPVETAVIEIRPFAIPDSWPRAFGMDIGWNRCLAKDSMVLLPDGTEKPIQELKEGDDVLAFDFKTENLVPAKVVDTFEGYARNMVTVGISEDQTVTCTDDHPFAHRGAAKDRIRFKKISEIGERIREFQSVVLPSGADRLLSKYDPAPAQDIYCITVNHPDHAFVCNGFVVSNTAAIWGAWDRSNDIVYLYDEHYVAEETPQVHADAIKGSGVKSSLRAPWIRGVIDPASKGRGQRDGEQLLETYRNLGLELEVAVNAVEAGIRQVWLRLSSGRLKVFSTLQYFFKEYLLYRRDENGKIMQSKARPDHLQDSLRYLIVSGFDHMREVPYQDKNEVREWGDPYMTTETSWMSS